MLCYYFPPVFIFVGPGDKSIQMDGQIGQTQKLENLLYPTLNQNGRTLRHLSSILIGYFFLQIFI